MQHVKKAQMKISVAICTYNGEKYLTEQLDSILTQSTPVNEIIVCDDGSTDETINVLENYKTNYPQLFNIYVNSKKLGTVKNFEKALSLTTGDFIFLSDQDDIWLPQKVKEMVTYMLEQPKALLYFSDGFLIDSNGAKIEGSLFSKWKFTEELQKCWLDNYEAVKMLINNVNKVTGATVCMRKQLLNIALPIHTPCGYWHDVWLAMHAAKNRGLFYTTADLILYRIHKDQQVGISKSRNIELLNAKECNKKNIRYNKYLKENYSAFYKFYDKKPLNFFERILLKINRGRKILYWTLNKYKFK